MGIYEGQEGAVSGWGWGKEEASQEVSSETGNLRLTAEDMSNLGVLHSR